MNEPSTPVALQALQTLYAQGVLALPPIGPIAFVGARAGSWLAQWPRGRMHVWQSFKPHADALMRAGLDLQTGTGQSAAYAAVLVLAPRQRDHARHVLACAVRLAAPNGEIIVAQANDEGASGTGHDFSALVGTIERHSKHHARVFRSVAADSNVDANRLADWLQLDDVRVREDGIATRVGLFAWDRVDTGSALLIEHLPTTLAGRVADLGAGVGVLAADVVRHCPGVIAIDLYEAEARAEGPARLNLEHAVTACGRALPWQFHWHDVTCGVPHRYDAVVMNPPFHIDRGDRPDLGRAFVQAAAAALEPHGELWFVANQHLPYEGTLRACFAEWRVAVVRDGFKVIVAWQPRR